MTRTAPSYARPPRVKHLDTVERLLNNKTRRWLLVSDYGTKASAGAIRWMIQYGRGLRAFEGKPFRFHAEVRWNDQTGTYEVWARRAAK